MSDSQTTDTELRSIREEAAAAGATTLIAFVYDQLRRDIVAGRFPPGDKLRIDHIRSTFGVAASTVREALARLAAEGLVTAEGQRGFRVAPMSRADLNDLTRLRQLLEVEAFIDAIGRGDVAWEGRVVAAFHALTRAEQRLNTGTADAFQAWEDGNKEFHRALTAACGSPRLLGLVEILYRQHERYRLQSLIERAGAQPGSDGPPARPLAPPRNVHSEHEALMHAALNRDSEAARRLLTDHIGKTAETVGARLR